MKLLLIALFAVPLTACKTVSEKQSDHTVIKAPEISRTYEFFEPSKKVISTTTFELDNNLWGTNDKAETNTPKQEEPATFCSIMRHEFFQCGESNQTAYWTLPPHFFQLPINRGRKGQYWKANDPQVVTTPISIQELKDNQYLVLMATKLMSGRLTCHGCPILLGAAIINKNGTRWQTLSMELYLDFQGKFGEIKSKDVTVLNELGDFRVNKHNVNQGYHIKRASIYGNINGKYKRIFQSILHESNKDSCGEFKDMYLGDCWSYTYTMSYQFNDNNPRANKIILTPEYEGTPNTERFNNLHEEYTFLKAEYRLSKRSQPHIKPNKGNQQNSRI